MKKEKFEKAIYLGKGLLLSYIITGVLIILFSLLLTFTPLKEARTPLLNTIVMIVSIVAGSIYLTTKIKENGWVSGAILGLSYYLILVLFNFIFLKSLVFDIFSITKLAITSITGVIGGIIGINLFS